MKKKLLLVTLIALIANGVSAQDKKKVTVPDEVKQAFAAKAPSVKNPEWEMEDGNFEAEYTEDGKETSMVFNAAGKHILTEKEIAVSELPANVAVDLAKRAAGKKIKEAARLDYADGTVMYEAECGDVDYIFDAKGNYKETEKEEKGEDDDDDKDDKKD